MTKKLRRLFPRLFGDQYRLTSKRTRRYNCLAWAAGQNDAWWEAPPDGFWPAGILDDGSILAAIRLYESLGYTCTTNRNYEQGVEKITIYGDHKGYTHAARQLPGGRWTSKLGKLQDIEHDILESIICDRYGQVKQIMERRPPAAPQPATT